MFIPESIMGIPNMLSTAAAVIVSHVIMLAIGYYEMSLILVDFVKPFMATLAVFERLLPYTGHIVLLWAVLSTYILCKFQWPYTVLYGAARLIGLWMIADGHMFSQRYRAHNMDPHIQYIHELAEQKNKEILQAAPPTKKKLGASPSASADATMSVNLGSIRQVKRAKNSMPTKTLLTAILPYDIQEKIPQEHDGAPIRYVEDLTHIASQIRSNVHTENTPEQVAARKKTLRTIEEAVELVITEGEKFEKKVRSNENETSYKMQACAFNDATQDAVRECPSITAGLRMLMFAVIAWAMIFGISIDRDVIVSIMYIGLHFTIAASAMAISVTAPAGASVVTLRSVTVLVLRVATVAVETYITHTWEDALSFSIDACIHAIMLFETVSCSVTLYLTSRPFQTPVTSSLRKLMVIVFVVVVVKVIQCTLVDHMAFDPFLVKLAFASAQQIISCNMIRYDEIGSINDVVSTLFCYVHSTLGDPIYEWTPALFWTSSLVIIANRHGLVAAAILASYMATTCTLEYLHTRLDTRCRLRNMARRIKAIVEPHKTDACNKARLLVETATSASMLASAFAPRPILLAAPPPDDVRIAVNCVNDLVAAGYTLLSKAPFDMNTLNIVGSLFTSRTIPIFLQTSCIPGSILFGTLATVACCAFYWSPLMRAGARYTRWTRYVSMAFVACMSGSFANHDALYDAVHMRKWQLDALATLRREETLCREVIRHQGMEHVCAALPSLRLVPYNVCETHVALIARSVSAPQVCADIVVNSANATSAFCSMCDIEEKVRQIYNASTDIDNALERSAANITSEYFDTFCNAGEQLPICFTIRKTLHASGYNVSYTQLAQTLVRHVKRSMSKPSFLHVFESAYRTDPTHFTYESPLTTGAAFTDDERKAVEAAHKAEIERKAADAAAAAAARAVEEARTRQEAARVAAEYAARVADQLTNGTNTTNITNLNDTKTFKATYEPKGPTTPPPSQEKNSPKYERIFEIDPWALRNILFGWDNRVRNYRLLYAMLFDKIIVIKENE